MGAAPSWAALEPTSQALVLCRHQQNVRTIAVTPGEGGCETLYTKGGVAEVVGRARNRDSCMGFLRNIQGNLQGAQWNCREVSQSSVTDLTSSQ